MTRVTIINNNNGNESLLSEMNNEEKQSFIKVAQVTTLGITNLKNTISLDANNKLKLGTDDKLFVPNETYLEQTDW
jgi:hypothetical protein